MWTRANLKQEAKQHLQGRYWSAFAVALIASLVGGGRASGTGLRVNSGDVDRFRERDWWNMPNGNWQGEFSDFINDFVANINGPMIVLLIVGLLLAAVFGILFTIFVSSVIEAGSARWFSRSREMANPPSIGFMFSLFRAGSYMQTVAAQFWRGLFLFLWSLLPIGVGIVGGLALFIPFAVTVQSGSASDTSWADTIGPILVMVYVLVMLLLWLVVVNRHYAYSMVPWILGDNPGIGRKQALNLSKEMTRGHKGSMFVLDLSFIGWYILGVLACGIGVLFVIPYHRATTAELYDRLRGISVDNGIARMEDYGFVKVDQ